jgi:hypothetical protein
MATTEDLCVVSSELYKRENIRVIFTRGGLGRREVLVPLSARMKLLGSLFWQPK